MKLTATSRTRIDALVRGVAVSFTRPSCRCGVCVAKGWTLVVGGVQVGSVSKDATARLNAYSRIPV